MTAIAAAFDVAAKRCGAAEFDRAHGTSPRGGQRCAMPVAKAGPPAFAGAGSVAEHIRHFQPSRATQPVLQVDTRSGAVGTMVCRDSSGLVVTQTLLVAIRRYWAVVLRLR
jgi:hypothetical protein